MTSCINQYYTEYYNFAIIRSVVILGIVMLSVVAFHPPSLHVVIFLLLDSFMLHTHAYMLGSVSYLSGLGMLILYRLPVQIRTTFGRISLFNDNNFSA
jgi:hypothetical protein